MFERKSHEDIEERIKIASYKYGLRGEDLQDATQEILCRLHEGKHKHSTVDQMLIDYLRSQSGRKGSLGYDTRKALVRAERFGIDNESDRGLIDRDQFGGVECGIDFGIYYRLVNGEINKAIFKLFYEWGFNEVEISNIFDVSCSRISQRIKGIQESLRQRIKIEESRKNQRELETILQQKDGGFSWGVESFEDFGLEKVESW